MATTGPALYPDATTFPSGGARIDQVSYIQRMEWSGQPGEPPSLVLGVSPL